MRRQMARLVVVAYNCQQGRSARRPALVDGRWLTFSSLLHQFFVYHYSQCHRFFPELSGTRPCQRGKFLRFNHIRRRNCRLHQRLPTPPAFPPLLLSWTRGKGVIRTTTGSSITGQRLDDTPNLTKRRQPSLHSAP